MSHIIVHSVIDVECVNSVSNRSKDIISLIIKVCRWFLLNNKIFTFHDYLHLQNRFMVHTEDQLKNSLTFP